MGALMDELKIAFDGEDMFVIVDGVKVAKRGHPRNATCEDLGAHHTPCAIARTASTVEFNSKSARVQ